MKEPQYPTCPPEIGNVPEKSTKTITEETYDHYSELPVLFNEKRERVELEISVFGGVNVFYDLRLKVFHNYYVLNHEYEKEMAYYRMVKEEYSKNVKAYHEQLALYKKHLRRQEYEKLKIEFENDV